MGGSLPTPAEAEARIRDCLRALPVETRPLATLAGAVLAEAIHAERDQPPFDRVTMDGIALASSSWKAGRRRFRIAGIQAAGRPALALESSDDCIEAMTGAVLPSGCDAVIPVERLAYDDGWAEVAGDVSVEPGLNVHGRARDGRAGDRLLGPGTRLGGPEVALIASAGRAEARVHVEPRVAVVSTGDELVDAGRPIEAWQVRRSNPAALRAALALRGYARVTEDHLPDDPTTMRDRLAEHLADHDAVVVSGGVSMGRYDHVPAVLAGLGVREVLHRVAQRPGKPLWFGVTDRGQPVFGLPGNPVSALVCLVRYVAPALAVLSGAAPPKPEWLPLAAGFRVRPPLTHFVPAQLVSSPGQPLAAAARPTDGSGDFIALAGTDGFVELPPGPVDLEPGTLASFRRW
ncbi:MAG: molybdopterin molybdotransferase MoeA [Steroidobacteraceae bacterium]